MNIPDEVRKCVVFVGLWLANGNYRVGGTGFFVARPIEGTNEHFIYIVTAKHNLTEIRKKGLDKVQLRVNTASGLATWIETEISEWLSHPTDPTVDVAVFSTLWNFNMFDQKLIPLNSFANEELIQREEIGIGEDIFLTGLFYNHYGQQRNLPIVRVGNIAAMPEEKVASKIGYIDAYLIESRSIGGLSGSPVFVNLGNVRWREGGVKFANKAAIFYLLGMIHGHFDERAIESDAAIEGSFQPESINMGIAMVVPAEQILEVLNQPKIRNPEL